MRKKISLVGPRISEEPRCPELRYGRTQAPVASLCRCPERRMCLENLGSRRPSRLEWRENGHKGKGRGEMWGVGVMSWAREMLWSHTGRLGSTLARILEAFCWAPCCQAGTQLLGSLEWLPGMQGSQLYSLLLPGESNPYCQRA